MQYFLYILAIPFLYFNYKIIISDLKYKKIPNKYLGYLLLLIPFYYIYIFFSFPELNHLLFLGQIIITFLVSFVLYYFGIWAAGDAKYLLVLSLFIPYIGIIPFIGNIALITLVYLFGYFLWFYFYKVAFDKNYRKSLWGSIKYDLSERWKVHKQNKGGNTYKIILKWFIIFLLIFVSIRLVRLYLLNSILENGNSNNYISEIIEKYNIYLVFLFIGIFIGGLYLFKIYINKIKKYISNRFKIDLNLVGNILLIILTIFLISFISFEYFKNPYEIKSYLFKIFTLYLALYIIFKTLNAAYKITFGIAEYQYINVSDLKEGDIVDKEYLIKSQNNFKIIYNKIKNNLIKIKIKNRYINRLYILSNLDLNFLDNKEIVIFLKQVYFLKNKLELKYTKIKKYKQKKNIKIIKTFSFAPYILFGFFISLLYGNIIKTLIIFIKIHYLG